MPGKSKQGSLGPRARGSVSDAETEGGLLSDLREVQCLICCLLHQMFIADPNIAKLVHFQVKHKCGKTCNGLDIQNLFYYECRKADMLTESET